METNDPVKQNGRVSNHSANSKYASNDIDSDTHIVLIHLTARLGLIQGTLPNVAKNSKYSGKEVLNTF